MFMNVLDRKFATDTECNACATPVTRHGLLVSRCRNRIAVASLKLLLVAGAAVGSACAATAESHFSVTSDAGNTLNVTSLGEFRRPWAMTFLPTGELLLTEKDGQLWVINARGEVSDTTFATATNESLQRTLVGNLPDVSASGQGGLGDVIAHPEYIENGFVYISYVERKGVLSGAAVLKARLDIDASGTAQFEDPKVIWRQDPKVTGAGHYGHRMAFSEEGYLYVTSGERQKFDPAQDMQMNLGKVVRLYDDGRIPHDNPWSDQGGIASQFWSIGHRNPLGVAFSDNGDLWVHEMGPRGGDELNRVQAGGNYGYPIVSDGRHYSGANIDDHDTRPDLQAPEITWTPVISPSSLIIYRGEQYTDWEGDALIGGLSSRSLVRVSLDGAVSEIERYDMNQRIREVEQDDTGMVYLLEDGPGGRLLRLAQP